MPVPDSPEEFARKVIEWAQEADVSGYEALSETIRLINLELVANTPFVTGTLRKSWYASVGALPVGIEGEGSVEQANLIAQTALFGDYDYYMVNVAPYALRIEYGYTGSDSLGRIYDQPGRFFVQDVLNRAPQIAEYAIRNVALRKSGEIITG